MARPRKVGKRWRIEIQVNGQKHSSYHDTKQAAANWALEQQVVHSETGFIRGRTMGMLFDRYAKEIAKGRKGERWDQVRLKVFTERWGNLSVMQFSRLDIERWRDERLQTVQASTINRELNLLSAVMSAAVKWRWCQGNPVRHVDRPRNPAHRERIISLYERDTLVKAMGLDVDSLSVETRRHELAIVFLVALETAMRLGEIVGLTWDNVFLSQQYVKLLDTKNGTDRDVPLTTSAVRYLTAMGPQNTGKVFGINRDTASSTFRTIRREVGLHDLTFHDTRHTAITNLAQVLKPFDLARMVGHKKLEMTLRYYNASASDIAKRLG